MHGRQYFHPLSYSRLPGYGAFGRTSQPNYHAEPRFAHNRWHQTLSGLGICVDDSRHFFFGCCSWFIGALFYAAPVWLVSIWQRVAAQARRTVQAYKRASDNLCLLGFTHKQIEARTAAPHTDNAHTKWFHYFHYIDFALSTIYVSTCEYSYYVI